MHRLIILAISVVALATLPALSAVSTVPEDERMIMSCDILQTLEDAQRQERGGSATPAYYWPDGIIPYAFDSDISQTNRNRVVSAMGIVQSHCSVLFVPRTNEPNWVQIGDYGGNWSYVGQIGGGQQLSIYNWNYPYIIAHELSHALGRHHQMCRSDRNAYVTINWNCIQDDCENNYQIAGSVNYEPYDFMSVMHYGQWDCSTGCPTMTCQPGYEGYQNAMGQSSYFTASDSSVLSQMYPGGEADFRVLFVQLDPDECDPGDDIDIFGVVKNDGDWFGRGISALIYLSDDADITTGDQLIGSQYFSYILGGGFGYVDTSITIPADTPEGNWYVGIKLTSNDDVNNENNTGSASLLVGDAGTPCDGDTDGSGTVDVTDLLNVISQWGPCSGCEGDLDGNDSVDVSDLLTVIANWGACP